MVTVEHHETDLLVIGAGGAGLFGALHADDTADDIDITLVVKKLAGKSGCTRMVQGGYNAVLHPDDSIDRHFTDTVIGGKFLNDQRLARALVEGAPQIIRELENEYGVSFDRDEDGHIHQKPFAGQSFDRTVHKGDLTGIEIMTKLRDELLTRNVDIMEETRAVDLLTRDDEVVGCLVLDIRSGTFTAVSAKSILIATGGGATMYKISTPALEKTADGQAMAFRAGAEFLDMEMMQYHPTGILAGNTKLTGGVLEEGIRGAGAHLYNSEDERFMEKYAPDDMERATRDIVSRASYQEAMNGRGTENGGVWLDATHLGKEVVEENFPGMTERTRNVGQDLSTQRVEVSPTAHYHMGGIAIDPSCQTNVPGLFAAGEDTGGVHGANRLGGNGVVNSTVFGSRAGDTVGEFVEDRERIPYDDSQVDEIVERVTAPLDRDGDQDIYDLRDELEETMWEYVGVVRDEYRLREGIERIRSIRDRIDEVGVTGSRRYNLEWNQVMDVENLVTIAELVARSGLERTESRGAHYRSDYPERDDQNWLKNIHMKKNGSDVDVWTEPVEMTSIEPGDVDEGPIVQS